MSKVIESEVKSLFSAPTFDRRAFVVTSLGAGFALAVLPVSAQTITTPADGLVAGEVKIPVAGGEMVAYRAMPATGGNFPVILVVSEIWGAHEHIRDVARRFAKLGYFAVAPELFARQGDAKAMADVQALIRDIVARTPDAQVMADLDAVVAYAKATGKVDGTSIGVTGFCWGGRIALMYAAHNPELDAAVAWYGPTARSYFPGDRTPLDVAAQTKVPVLGLYGGADGGIPNESVEKYFAALKSAGNARSAFMIYPETPHAFHADYRPTYRKDKAEDGWKRAVDWFKQHLA